MVRRSDEGCSATQKLDFLRSRQSWRSCFKTLPNDFAIEPSSGLFGPFFFIEGALCANVDYKSTDYSMNFLI